MPNYDYVCTKCNSFFELNRPMAEAGKPQVCPRCGYYAQPILRPVGIPREGSLSFNAT